MSTLNPPDHPAQPIPPTGPPQPPLTLAPEDYPSIEHLVIEDGAPVDSRLSEKQMRLLTEPLYSSWPGPGEGRSFMVCAHVGLFIAVNVPPLVPDVMFSADIQPEGDLSKKEEKTYLVWLRGKLPEVVIEIVSNKEGGEAGPKLVTYARWGVPYYVIYDPVQHLGSGVLRVFRLDGGEYHPAEARFPLVNLGLTLWQGTFEGVERAWLRWCDAQGNLILTGKERADQEKQRADHLAALLRKAGIQLEG